PTGGIRLLLSASALFVEQYLSCRKTLELHVAFFFFSSRRRHTRSVSAFLLNRSSDLCLWKPSISTLSQSPMLGFHKQMDNRIKLLEEILSFRMQGVEFDNGDMYVDGH